MALEVTAVFRAVPEGYIAWVEEMQGVHTQGDTLQEARENLLDAAQLMIEVLRKQCEEDADGEPLIRETLVVPIPPRATA